jgi:transposase
MARPYSGDLRQRVVEAVTAGASSQVAAARFQVSISFVIKLMQRWRATGSVAARPVGGKRPFRLAGHAELVRQLLADQPDVTLEELRRQLADRGVQVGRSSIDRFLASLGLTRKKRRNMPPSRPGPTLPRPGPPGEPSSRA